MTAPGQEPDEILTGAPGSDATDDLDDPDLARIGDSHMPQDVREAVRDEVRRDRGEEPTGHGTLHAADLRNAARPER